MAILNDREEAIFLKFIEDELCKLRKEDALTILNLISRSNTRMEWIKEALRLNNVREKKHALKTPKRQKIEESQTSYNEFNGKNIDIYCDGSCSGNPGAIGSGIAIYENGKLIASFIGGYERRGTNNIAELKALGKALDIAKDANSARIYSDSKYSIDSITTWAKSWEKNGWRKSGNKEIKNLDIIKSAYDLNKENADKITINYVKGHSGNKGNDMADKLANRARSKKIDKFIAIKS